MRVRKRGDEVETELNLVPIMNLFTALIPFLLLSAAFIQIKVINASVPAIADGSDPVNEEKAYDKRPVVVNVQVARNGYSVTANGDDLTPRELKKLKADIRDEETLRRYFEAVKREHPKSDTVIIAPDANVPYERIVAVMDLSRGTPTRYLFPKVVVTSLHQ